MPADASTILKLDVPVIVVLGQRAISLREVLGFAPGCIVEIPKDAESELDLCVNNKPIGSGKAVKVGENFGLRLTYVGDLKSRVIAIAEPAPEPPPSNTDADAMAEAMLAGQS